MLTIGISYKSYLEINVLFQAVNNVSSKEKGVTVLCVKLNFMHSFGSEDFYARDKNAHNEV